MSEQLEFDFTPPKFTEWKRFGKRSWVIHIQGKIPSITREDGCFCPMCKACACVSWWNNKINLEIFADGSSGDGINMEYNDIESAKAVFFELAKITAWKNYVYPTEDEEKECTL